MDILITGVAGFLGSRFAQWLALNVSDARITGIDDLSCGYIESVPNGVKFVNYSLGSGTGLALGKTSFDFVFHFAAYAAEGLSPFIRCYNYRNNLLATAEVVNYCLKRPPRRLVFTSSMAVYGASGSPPFDEDQQPRPIDPYGVAKHACEQDIAVAGEQHQLEWTIIRPHNVYGPGQSVWQKYRNVLGLWMASHLAGGPLVIFGDGSQTRAFSYIDDILPCLWIAATSAETRSQVINLGGIIPVSVKQAALALSNLLGGTEIVYAQPRHEARHAWCTWQKSVDLLGFRHQTELEAGLAQMYSWVKNEWKKHPGRRSVPASFNIEVCEGLYEYWR